MENHVECQKRILLKAFIALIYGLCMRYPTYDQFAVDGGSSAGNASA